MSTYFGTMNPSVVHMPSFQVADTGAQGGGGGTAGAGGSTSDSNVNNDGNRADTSRVDAQNQNANQNEQNADGNRRQQDNGMVPRYRLNEESSARQKLQSDFETLNKRYEEQERRLRAAFGVETADPVEQEAAEIRKALFKVFPGLEAIGDLSAEDLRELLITSRNATSASQHHWERHADNMISKVESEIAKSYGTLSDRHKKAIRREYREVATECASARKRAIETQDGSYDFQNDFLGRHERSDEALVAELAKNWLDDWYVPARRNATGEVTSRLRPVPSNKGGRPISTPRQKPDISTADKFAEALMKARDDSQ